MVTVPRPPPTMEVQRIYDRNASVGQFLQAAGNAKQAEKAEEERKAAVPSVREEAWKRRKKSGVWQPGRVAVEVCRNAKGKFSRLYTPQELALHFGIMTGRDVPSPAKTKGQGMPDADPQT